jgi:two-component system sensor histidine kinase PilS (NtrC family)
MLDYEYRTEDVRPGAVSDGTGEASGRFVITFAASI